MRYHFSCIAVLISLVMQAHAQDNQPDLLSFVDRPSISDSAMVVPYHYSVVEMGYLNFALTDNSHAQNTPQAVYRIGLPEKNELNITFPSYTQQQYVPNPGLSAANLGVKHILTTSDTFTASIEAILTLPSGSDANGSEGYGEAVNGIVNFSLSPTLSLTGMAGLTSQTDSVNNGGRRYASFNPIMALSWSKEKLQIFAEVFAQTKTSYSQGAGLNVDTGIQYLMGNNIVVDVEVGKHLKGHIGGYDHYIGAGMAILLS